MANWGIILTDFLQGGLKGYDQGQEDTYRQLRTNQLRRDEKYVQELNKPDVRKAMGLPEKEAAKKGWMGQIGDAIGDAWSRVVDGGSSGTTPQQGVRTGEVISTVDRRNAPNPGDGAVDIGSGSTFGVRPDQTEVGEGTSRSAFGYTGGGSDVTVPGTGGDVQGSSGATPPPGVTRGTPPPPAQPSAEAQALAASAVRRAGGNPSAPTTSTAVPTPGTYGASQNVPGTGVNPQLAPPGATAPYGVTDPRSQDPGAGEQVAGGGTYRPGVANRPMIMSGSSEAQGGLPDRGGVVDQSYRPDGPTGPQPPKQPRRPDASRSQGVLTGEVTTTMPGVHEGADVIQIGPPRQRGAIATPEDQRREAEVIRRANQPLPEGSRPADATRLIASANGKPDGSLPTSADMQYLIDTVVPRLMTIDPERALRFQAQLGESMRQGASMWITRAQIAWENGNMPMAQQALMKAYNQFMPTGDKAQFTVSPDGKKILMTRFDDKSGKQIDGKPVEVTSEQLQKLGMALYSPQAYAQYMLSRDQFDETKRSNRTREGLQASAQAQQAKHWQMDYNIKLRQLELSEARETRMEAQQKAALTRQGILDTANLAKTTLETLKLQGGLDVEAARRNGMGYHLGPNPDAWAKDYGLRIDEALATVPKQQEAVKPTIASSAAMLGMFNSQLSPAEAVKIAAAWAATPGGINIIGASPKGGYSIADVGGKKIAVPDVLLQDKDKSGGTVGSLPPQVPQEPYDVTSAAPGASRRPIGPGPRTASALPSAEVSPQERESQDAIEQGLRRRISDRDQAGARTRQDAISAFGRPPAPAADVQTAVAQAAAGIKRAGNPPGALASAARDISARLKIPLGEAQRMLQEALR